MRKKVFYIVLSLLFLFTFYTEISISYGLFVPDEYFFLVPLFLLSLLALLICIVIDIFNRSKLWQVPILLLLTIILCFGIGRFVSNWQNENTIENMDKVVSAIESYKKMNKKYPADLNVLIPIWINEIPKSYCGFKELKFEYNKNIDKNWGECVMLRIYDRHTISYRQYDMCDNYTKPRINFNDYFNH